MPGLSEELPLDVESLDLLLSNVGDVLSVLNDDGETLYVSPSIREILGHRPDERIGRPAFDLVHPEDEERAQRRFRQAIESPGTTREVRVRLRHANGERRRFHVRGRRSREGEEIQGLVQISRDITGRRERERRLQFQALHDSLTKLPNRRPFEDRLEQALARQSRTGERCAVLYMDLNGFKQVNDTLGHHVGDRMLQRLGRRLRLVTRDEDTVARLGGDEFLALVERVESREQVGYVAERLIEAVESPVDLEGTSAAVSVAVGAAVSEGNSRVTELLNRADEAMYRAKESKPSSGFCLDGGGESPGTQRRA